ncbi:MAG: nucleotidyl transferase AbiEii/AbiGii toxin family protein [Bacteroidota bacterium]
MIDLNYIRQWYPEHLQQPQYSRFIIREFLHLQILDFIANSKYASALCFIGGTNLRLIYGINRFSEDLDFDNKNMTRDNFIEMTDSLIRFLNLSGFSVDADDKTKDTELNAFRRNIVFPEFLYKHNLSAFRNEKFLIKIESQNQHIQYNPDKTFIKSCGFVFHINTPPLPVMCAMKISALLNRSKGRDFYDVMFLLEKTMPDFDFLRKSDNIKNKKQLIPALKKLADNVNLKHKSKDFEHLMYDQSATNKVLLFKEFVDALD